MTALGDLVDSTLSLFDPLVRARLQKCIPFLEEALNRWCSQRLVMADAEMILACATPASAIVLESDRWLEVNAEEAAKIAPAGIGIALANAIEGPPTVATTNLILCGYCCLLGHARVVEKMKQAMEAKANGHFPLHIMLIDRGDDVAAAEATLILPCRDGATLH